MIDLEIAAAFVVALVEVADALDTTLLRGIAKRVEDRPVQALLFNPPLTAVTVEFRGAGKMVFALLEKWQHIFPGPAGIVLGPAVVVPGLAAHVDHAVDRRTTAQHLSPRIAQRTALQAFLGFGLEAPVGARVADAEQIADGNMDPGIVIATAGFKQQHAMGRVGRQSIGQQAACGAGAYHHVIVFSSCRMHL